MIAVSTSCVTKYFSFVVFFKTVLYFTLKHKRNISVPLNVEKIANTSYLFQLISKKFVFVLSM